MQRRTSRHPGRYRGHRRLAAFTGMRQAELQALKWGDVDLTERTGTWRLSEALIRAR